MWQNDYVGIPYKHYGRDRSGIDCWGLARLIYKEEYNIDLPSFSEPGVYEASDRKQIAEIFAQNMEGWAEVDSPETGNLAVFRILGQPSHIGIAVSKTHFIHAMEGHSTVIEAFDSTNWRHRCIGFFKYTPNNVGNNLVAVPHPLRTEKFILTAHYGTTIQQVYEDVNKQHNINEQLKKKITILKNSKVVPKSEWATTVIKHGDTLEYRAVPGDDLGRMALTLLVLYVAVTVVGPAAAGSAALQGALGISAAQASALAVGATIMAGTYLINAIMPIRPPSAPEDPGSARSQLLLTGGSNQANPYGTIPFVLGKVRLTPPLGAQNFARFGELSTGIVDSADKSYLDMLLIWGYGPLHIDPKSLRLGDVPFYEYSGNTLIKDNFLGLRQITLDRKTTESQYTLDQFNSIYGKDVQQEYVGVSLTCAGLPPVNVIGTNNPWVPSNSPGAFVTRAFSQPSDKISVALHFPQGLRAIIAQGTGAGSQLPAPVSVTIEYRTTTQDWTLWTTQTIGGTIGETEELVPTYEDGSGGYTLPANRITGGAPRKDAFTWTITKDRLVDGVSAWPANEPVQIRVRRNTGDETEPGNYRYSHAVVLQTITAISNTAPAVDPKNVKIAKTALTIQATDQLNNQIDGINGIVQTWCLDWNGSVWTYAATSNPASLFRHVLQSAANPQRILDSEISTKLDLPKLQYWHEFCNLERTDPETGQKYKYQFNDVIAAPRSVLEILRDICAAGKASPALVDGKWTVIIDEPRTVLVNNQPVLQVIQHFSPHNSWGFESTKILPKLPDAIKVQYNDEDYDYQQRELIIPFANKTVATSELFETIQLPGVTNKGQAKDHARWHMAQVKLRPEIYTLNTDLEYLVCNRGDLVKVSHDVPMWGLGSGRIKNITFDPQTLTATQLELDEEMPMSSTISYTIRVRSKTGGSKAITVLPKQEDGYYSSITLAEPVTAAQVDVGDLFLFGSLNTESQDLIVLSIEPSSNKTARLTLIDYGVTSTYNIFTDYLTLSSSVIFESQVTLPPKLLITSFGTKKPTITSAISDETVMEVISPGVYAYKVLLAYTNADKLPENTLSVQAQIDYASATDTIGINSISVPYAKGSVVFSDVEEGASYRIRLRYVAADSRVGEWTDWYNHTVVGKTNPPSVVTGFSYTVNQNTGKLILDWNNNPELDVVGYEIRYTDANWGTNNLYAYKGTNSVAEVDPNDIAFDNTWFIRAYDANGNYSTSSASISFAIQVPGKVNVNEVKHTFADTSLTSATVTITWPQAPQTLFRIAGYTLSYYFTNKDGDQELVEVFTNSTTITVPANWVGIRSINITTVDVVGLESEVAVAQITKYLPDPVPIGSYTAKVIDNNVLLFWELPEKTSLPIAHVLIRKAKKAEGTSESSYSWETAENIGEKSGTFTSFSEIEQGEYIYFIRTVDTDGRESSVRTLTRKVAQPPDYVFNDLFVSTFSGTRISAAININNNSLLMPVNTTENWEQHFDTNDWDTPQDQINASFPYYPQPGTVTASYTEIFEYGGAPLPSTQISLEVSRNIIAGSPDPTILYYISYSEDGNVYSTPQLTTSLFGTAVKYVKVEIQVIENSPNTLVEITSLSVRLDSKKITDSYSVNALETDVSGTIVNFSKPFIDVVSINVSVNGSVGTSPPEQVTCMYDFRGEVRDNLAYVISSNVCTITCTDHGLITGQNVRLTFSSGTGINGVYTITKISDNVFTCNITASNTSGTVNMYPNSFTVYVFNAAGQRRSRQVSWQIQGF